MHQVLPHAVETQWSDVVVTQRAAELRKTLSVDGGDAFWMPTALILATGMFINSPELRLEVSGHCMLHESFTPGRFQPFSLVLTWFGRQKGRASLEKALR